MRQYSPEGYGEKYLKPICSMDHMSQSITYPKNSRVMAYIMIVGGPMHIILFCLNIQTLHPEPLMYAHSKKHILPPLPR